LINNDPDFVQGYDVIIANNLSNATLSKLSDAVVKHKKILVTLRTNGMSGIVRLFADEHRVKEKKTDAIRFDLRLQHPWKELEEFCDTFDLEAYYADIDNRRSEFVHSPFIAILVQGLRHFKELHGHIPATEQEKQDFQELILSSGKEYRIATNFEEARENSWLCYVPYRIPDEVQQILSDDKTKNVTANSNEFWILARGLLEFVNNEGGGIHLPLQGSLPDVSTFAYTYVSLQRIYNAKAAKDVQAFGDHVKRILKSIGRDENSISQEKLAFFFCKQSTDLQVFRYTPVSNEFEISKLNKGFEFWEDKGKWFLANYAAGRFHAAFGRLPGDRNGDPMLDLESLKKISDAVCTELAFEDDDGLWLLSDTYLKEICRFGGSQIHTTAAYIGGVASQEVIKLLTKQWVPINNTFIYDGITGTGGCLTL